AAQPLTILSRLEALDTSGFRRDCRSARVRNACPLSPATSKLLSGDEFVRIAAPTPVVSRPVAIATANRVLVREALIMVWITPSVSEGNPRRDQSRRHSFPSGEWASGH